MMKKGFVLIGIALGMFGRVSAQQDSLTVEQAVAYALRNNYAIMLAKQDSAVAAINYEYRNAAFLPRLNATGTALFSNNNQKQTLADGSEKNRTGIRSTNLSSALNLSWTVFDGFRMFLLRDQIGIAVNQGNLLIKSTVINTVASVINTYFDIVRQKQQLRNVDEQLQLAADRLRLAQYKFDIGAGIKPDVLQSQIDLNNSTAARLNQLALIDQRKQTLNQLMNVAPATDYKVSDTIPVQTDLVLGNLLSNFSQSSPDLQLARTNIESAELAVRLAKTARYPTVSLISAYNFNRTSNNQVINQFSPLFNLNHGWNWGISATIPILNNFTVRQQIRQAQLAVDFQNLQYKSQEQLLNTNLLNTYRGYDAQKQIVTTLDTSVGLARENLYIERERYRLGRTTFIELRQAEENVSTILTNLINARYNLKVAETELLRLRGELVK
ncbi:TolC family protein [Flavisolibacter nicotianae]|uniref:TolC family protein n=1 Tax=Flavisolibacter nicotianae TaxID=2364882 RepID=UPI0013C4A3D9|nr:TolC family protein [Flavisolibacter nicotianae]